MNIDKSDARDCLSSLRAEFRDCFEEDRHLTEILVERVRDDLRMLADIVAKVNAKLDSLPR